MLHIFTRIAIAAVLMISLLSNAALASDKLPNGRPDQNTQPDLAELAELYDTGLVCLATARSQYKMIEHFASTDVGLTFQEQYEHEMATLSALADRYNSTTIFLLMAINDIKPNDMNAFIEERVQLYDMIMIFWESVYIQAYDGAQQGNWIGFNQLDMALVQVKAQCDAWENSFTIE